MISQPFCTMRISLEVSRRDGIQTPQDESQLPSDAEPAFCCEVISQTFLDVCEISQTSFSPAKWSLVLPDICDRHFGIFFFRFLCLNFHFLLIFNHSCNSLARKYPRKGKLPSYINSLASTVIIYVIYVIHRSIYRIYRALLYFSFSFIFHFFLFLANQTLRIFPQRMRG